MLTNLAKREVSVSGLEPAREFTIAANGKAFKALIDGLYSDKIRAVIRELWSNAYDAHVSAGCADEAFECQLPTVFDPVFRVRDYGVSLCHEDVMDLYTTVFRSTKDGNNNHVGKFGLGSKSPFAYVDTFSVTAWLTRLVLPYARVSPGKLGTPCRRQARRWSKRRHEKRTYSCFIGSDHIPRIAPMSCEPTDEPRGFEVSFPCQAGDVDAFVSAAKKVGLGFEVLPTMSGHPIQFAELDTITEDAPLWRLVKDDSYSLKRNTAYARQGCVVYPLDAGAIPGATELHNAVLTSPFFINFPIGDLEIATNREALGYDERTCRNILRVVDVIASEVRARYEKDIDNCATFWEACLKLRAMQASSLAEGVKRVLNQTIVSWHGRKMLAHIEIGKQLEPLTAQLQGGFYSESALRRRKGMKWERSRHVQVEPGKTAIYVEDTSERVPLAGGRIRYHYDMNRVYPCNEILWVKCDPKSFAWKRLYARLGRPPVVRVNDLARPPIQKGYGTRAPVSVRQLSDSGRQFEIVSVDEDDDIVYVNMERGEVIGPNRYASTYDVQVTLDFLRNHGVLPLDTKVIGVPRSCVRQLRRNTHWRCLWAIAEEAIDKNFDPKLAARSSVCSEIAQDSRLAFVAALHEAGATPAATDAWAHKLLKVYTSVHVRAQSTATQREWLAFAQRIRGAVPLPRYAVRWEPMADRFEETYPLLTMINRHFNDETRNRLLDYVNLVDASRSNSHTG